MIDAIKGLAARLNKKVFKLLYEHVYVDIKYSHTKIVCLLQVFKTLALVSMFSA